MYVEVGRYLNQLAQDFASAGGHLQVRKFASAEELAQLPERLIFNCTGLGARDLFGDLELEPARGQIAVLAPQPEVQYAYTLDGAYMFPRPDGIILGGTFERGEWDTTPDPRAIAGILAAHHRLIDRFRCSA
jgi:D-amino-acid oxidase